MMKIINNKSGYTFLEVMIAFSIFGILILSVYATFFNELNRFEDRLSQISMNIEATRAMSRIKETVVEYDNISIINGNSIFSNGINLIDAEDDGDLEGSKLNLEFENHRLLDYRGDIIATNVDSIEFVIGPIVQDDIGISEDVLLIVIKMKSKNGSFTLKGGLNIER